MAKAKGLELRCVSTDRALETDPILLERILRNYLENAIHYTARGKVLIGCRLRGDFVDIQVFDTGIGIKPELQAKIFDEFYQIGNPERDRTQGLGLGLSIVRRISGLLGLDVGVRSEPGRGSVFFVSVPIAESNSIDVPRRRADNLRALRGITIVVIDDDPVQRIALKGLLEKWGSRIVLAASGEDAVQALQESGTRPDIILSDFRLQAGRTGAEAILLVRSAVEEETPGIILTGDTEPARLIEATNSEFLLLHKPIDTEQLGEALLLSLRSGQS
ncbi:MAG: ATP-binding protein, partial [Rhodospirillales bacterium]|nr:ATP-binding protein [Rhodospirillales bacterium]